MKIKFSGKVLLLISVFLSLNNALAAQSESGDAYTGATVLSDGKLQTLSDGTYQAWDAEQQQWVAPEQFWLNYAARHGGLTWGQSTKYPPYEQVKEFNTLLIELDGELCLMEFFHQRWRRANDVRRWSDDFNQIGACARVFE